MLPQTICKQCTVYSSQLTRAMRCRGTLLSSGLKVFSQKCQGFRWPLTSRSLVRLSREVDYRKIVNCLTFGNAIDNPMNAIPNSAWQYINAKGPSRKPLEQTQAIHKLASKRQPTKILLSIMFSNGRPSSFNKYDSWDNYLVCPVVKFAFPHRTLFFCCVFVLMSYWC